MSKPLFSVLIPTFNRRHTLIDTLESVRLQTLKSWEIIVMDDGSTDGTADAIEDYIAQHPEMKERFTYLVQENAGKSVALNNSIPYIKGEWVAFLDSDDLWMREKLEKQYITLEKYRKTCGACFTNARYINNPLIQTTVFERAGRHFKPEHGVFDGALEEIIKGRHGIPIQSLVVQAKLLSETGGFDPVLRVAEDWDFTYRLAHRTEFCFVNLALVEIDRTPGRPVGLVELMNRQTWFFEQRMHLFERWLDEVGREPGLERSLILEQIRALHSEWVNYCLEIDDHQNAVLHAEKAFRLDPNLRMRAKLVLTRTVPRLTRRLFRNEDRVPLA